MKNVGDIEIFLHLMIRAISVLPRSEGKEAGIIGARY
jgi:hypothetical protein